MVDTGIDALSWLGYYPVAYVRDDLHIALHQDFVSTECGAVTVSDASRALQVYGSASKLRDACRASVSGRADCGQVSRRL